MPSEFAGLSAAPAARAVTGWLARSTPSPARHDTSRNTAEISRPFLPSQVETLRYFAIDAEH